MRSWFASLRGRSLGFQSAVLGLAVLSACALAAPIAAWHRGSAGVITATVAAGLCWLGAQAALVLARPYRQPQGAWQGMLLGMLPRMGVPLAAGLVFQLRGGMLAQSGLLVYLVVFYPVALWAETILCLPACARPARSADAPPDVTL